MRHGIIRTAVRVLRQRPGLLGFPALGLLAIAVAAALSWPLLLQDVWDRADHHQGPSDAEFAALAVLLFLAFNLSSLATAALLHSVHALLGGERLPLTTSIRAVGRRVPTLLAWTLFSLGVGSVLKAGESVPLVAVLFDVVGFTWSMLTFFALPVIVIEGAGLLTGLRRSLALARGSLRDWVVGGFKLFLTALLVAVLSVVVLIFAVESNSLAVVLTSLAGIVAAVLLVTVLNSAASGIYRVTLYRDAVARVPRPAD